MTATAETTFDDCCQAFAESYELSNLPAMREVERSVLGCDYGGTSWTTDSQAQQIADLLDLKPGVHVLDIGAGSGWPGLFLADISGCDVTLLDLPKNALAKARQRALDDGIENRVNALVGSGAALPFADGSFEAISHSDVLCCLPQKIEMLRECRRIATDGANMLFSVIATARNLSDADYERAIEAGPPFIEAPDGYDVLLEACGWRVLQRFDATPDHRNSLNELVRAFETSTALADTLGQDVVREAAKHRAEQIAVIDAGLMVREIFYATAV
jgi:ubiquinone/menaquinone biosynthesis C-methylase UbiE